MVITIHELPVGSFTFLQCLSGTELLNLSGIPYMSARGSSACPWSAHLRRSAESQQHYLSVCPFQHIIG
jgi:hypothetical protein